MGIAVISRGEAPDSGWRPPIAVPRPGGSKTPPPPARSSPVDAATRRPVPPSTFAVQFWRVPPRFCVDGNGENALSIASRNLQSVGSNGGNASLPGPVPAGDVSDWA